MQYDDIVLGAGSSGAVVAARLSEDPARRVLLVEAGPDYPNPEAYPSDLANVHRYSLDGHDWGFVADALDGREIGYARGRVVGGTSAVNSAIALRGLPADYDEWVKLGAAGWGWSDVLPWFRRIEDDAELGDDAALHGRGGPLPIRRYRRDELTPLHHAFYDACLARGFADVADHNDPSATGVGPYPMNRVGAVRISTAIAYLRTARDRKNLEILPNALVRRVLFSGDRVEGVELVCAGRFETKRASRVTLSCGAIGTPPVLVRSGIGPRAVLDALGIASVLDLPGVGQNLLDHPTVGVAVIAKPDVIDRQGPQVQVICRTTAKGSSDFNDLQLSAVGYVDFSRIPHAEALVGAPWATVLPVILERVRAKGQLRFKSADPDVAPIIELRLADDPEDERRLIEGVRTMWTIAHTEPLSDRIERIPMWTEELLADDETLRALVRMAVFTGWHPAGTARMGADADPLAVVDAHCRVRGVRGLYVADASVMPSIPRANTNLTCILIGERVADWLRQS